MQLDAGHSVWPRFGNTLDNRLTFFTLPPHFPMQDTLYGLASAAGVLEGEGEAAEGPVMDVLPGMVPATGQYYLAMRWVDKVRGGGGGHST